MNNYKIEVRSRGDLFSATLKKDDATVNVFYGATTEDVINLAKDYAEYLNDNPLQSEIIWKDGNKTITYYIRGKEEWMVLYDKKNHQLEAKTLVNKEGHISHSFSDALEILKNTILEDKTQIINL